MVTDITFWSESYSVSTADDANPGSSVAMSAVLFTRSIGIAMSLGFAGTLVTLILSFYLLSVFDPEKGGIQLAEQSDFLGIHLL